MTYDVLGIVVNPNAKKGKGHGVASRVLAQLSARGYRLHNLSGETAQETAALVSAANQRGIDALVVVGGDGVVHTALNAVMGTDLPLGIIPAGTGNDIARSLGLPLNDHDAAIACLEEGFKTGGRRIDAVRVTSKRGIEWFLGTFSAGLDAAANARANTLRWPRGQLRYVRAVVQELFHYSPYDYRVIFDEDEVSLRSAILCVANGQAFGGGLLISPESSMDDGLLDVIYSEPVGIPTLLRVFPRLYTGSHLKHPQVLQRQVRKICISYPGGHEPPEAYADGEPLGALPLVLEIVPRSVPIVMRPIDV